MTPPDDGVRTVPDRAIERRRAFGLLFGCLMVTGVGNSLTFAILPPVARAIAMPDVSVSFIYTLSGTLFLIMSQVWGSVSDRTGRKPLILMGLSGFAVTMIVLAAGVHLGLSGAAPVVAVFALLAGARAVFGAIGSASGPAATAYVADRTPPGRRTQALAALSAAFGFGGAVGPGFAAWMTPRFGLIAPMVVIAVVAAVAAVLVRLFLPERTPPKDEAGRARTPAWRFFADPRLRMVLAYGGVIWIAQAVGLQTANFYVMDRVGVSGADAAAFAGGILTGGALAMLAAQIGAIPLLKPSPRAAMLWGAGVMTLAALLMANARSFGEIMFAFTLSGFGMGLARPGMAAAASLAVEEDEQGAAAGAAAATAGVGFLLAPAAGLGLYTTVGPSTPYWLLAVLCLIATALAAFSASIQVASRRGAG